MKLYKKFPYTAVLVLGSAAIAFGCGKSPQVEDAQTARASTGDREQILMAEREVDEARASKGAYEAALSEAEKFEDIVEEERASAEDQVEATRRNVELVRGTEAQAPQKQYPETQGQEKAVAEHSYETAKLQLKSAEAKEAFAEALEDLREMQLDAAESKVTHKESLVQLAKFDVAAQAGTADNKKRNDFVESELKAREDVEMKDLQVRQNEGRVEELREQWQQARQTLLQASPAATGSDAPPPAEPDPGVR